MNCRSFIVTLLLATCSVTVLPAGGQQDSTPVGMEGRREIVLWWEPSIPERQAALNELLVDGFNRSQDEYYLTIEFRAELEQQLRIGLMAGNGPDVVLSNAPASVTNLVGNGRLLSLETYADRYGWRDEFVPVMLDLATVGGELYALPKTYESIVLYYNETLFEENGWSVPTTAEEFATVAEQIKAQGIVPVSGGNSDWRGANEWYVTVVLNHIAGPNRVYRALIGEIPWTDPAFVEAIETLTGWWDRGWFSDDYYSLNTEQGWAQIASRNAAMTLNGSWAFQWEPPYFGRTEDTMNWVPVPQLSADVSYPLYTLGIGTLLAIAADSDVPDGAAMVLDYITQESFITEISGRIPGEWNVPITTISSEDLAATTTELFARHVISLGEAAAEGDYGYTTWSFWPPETNTYIYEAIEQVWLGEISAAEYLQNVDEIFQRERAEGRVPPIPVR
ncbi:MAG: extracellular solute-binding protein [Spirochaetales bacterium]|nr:extracellular solute-binding protein [Spirochaetales bacterium]